MATWMPERFNREYALETLLRIKTTAKINPFRLHHSGVAMPKLKKVDFHCAFDSNFNFLIHNLGLTKSCFNIL